MATSENRLRTLQFFGLLAAAMLLQLPLIANPGYFSHDELQWAARAFDGVRIDWRDIGALQYRPLTFSAWMLLSRTLFAQPMLYHAAIALLGSANAVLLATLLRRAGASSTVAAAAALAFVLNPYAMYVHGWVAALGDVIWCLCTLLIGGTVLASRRAAVVVAVSALLTVAALLAKESALSIPAMAAVAYFFDSTRRPRWRLAVMATGLVSITYLLMRQHAFVQIPDADSYAWHLRNIPVRLFQYELYPFLPRVFEVHNTLEPSPKHFYFWFASIMSAGCGLLALLAALGRCHWRWVAGFLAGGAAALGPTLVLDNPATQYGYALAAWNAGLFALAWPRFGRMQRAVVLIAIAVIALHAALVARAVLHVGRVQAVYSPAVATAVAASGGTVRVSARSSDDTWIFLRLSNQIPSYRGVPLMDRLHVVPTGEPADYLAAPDGTLERVR